MAAAGHVFLGGLESWLASGQERERGVTRSWTDQRVKRPSFQWETMFKVSSSPLETGTAVGIRLK